MSRGFQQVPILDWNLIQSGQKSRFILQLRDALINVGFMYLQNPPVDTKLVQGVKDFAPKLFDLPLSSKESLKMSNSPHFLGYSRLGNELTRGTVDQREQFDFGTPYQCQWKEGDPDYLKLWGPAQWPEEKQLPGFKETLTSYLSQVEALSEIFTELVSEALGLEPTALDVFFDNPKSSMQHRSKVVKYPPVTNSTQGVGPHTDSGFLTFLLQASDHRGLQAQNLDGQWIDIPPLENTLVVNLGKGLETVTKQVAIATTHQVLSPEGGSGCRYSIPFFQIIRQNLRLRDVNLDFLPEILALRDARGTTWTTDAVNYREYDQELSGHVSLIGRIKSHPDVAERHYPELFKLYFSS
ncbi:Clavaminate synthase-like protein [Serendipita vermifera]|nr:Clavaminate synthase-like protein [Serendipita vermifera]